MIARLFYSLLFSMVGLLILVPFNFYLSTNFRSPELQREAGFISLVIVEMILIFNTVFQMVDAYFTAHPDYKKLIIQHKNEHPNIPEKYYERNDGEPKDSNNTTKANGNG